MGTGRQIGLVEVDMSPFIGKNETQVRLGVPKCEIANCFIEFEIKVAETVEVRNEDDSGDEEYKANSDASPLKGDSTYSNKTSSPSFNNNNSETASTS